MIQGHKIPKDRYQLTDAGQNRVTVSFNGSGLDEHAHPSAQEFLFERELRQKLNPGVGDQHLLL
ncbi:hypothetical protein TRM7557_01474 [Tritonibacter multivorans]|uniref:Uncharacterized protein n=1 Tax=Tritonibacter multivorans TaxID=928856 RepID=A0A0P1G7S5_9RHOB|nr:hypothetical protein TRM7557_01474 [Tritonibacter multivorans]SFD34891.1 hypothetical protein SAMN04488049_111135 [Tritonibacter multivorans]